MIDRSLAPRVLEALADTRVVVVLGARQVGKSTLVEHIATERMRAAVLSLDDAGTREAAASDPTGFVADNATPVVIDEVQRVPDLLLAIKARADRDRRPGQYLLTGSANVLTALRIADALTGRAEYLRLGPFTQGELHNTGATFVSDLLDGRWPRAAGVGAGRQAEWQEDVPRAYHFRDRDGREVDLVLERRDGSVAGVEVKSAASVTNADFRGLRHLRDKLGERFKLGVVLYTGERALPFGDRLAVVPISGMWASAA